MRVCDLCGSGKQGFPILVEFSTTGINSSAGRSSGHILNAVQFDVCVDCEDAVKRLTLEFIKEHLHKSVEDIKAVPF